MTRPFPNPSFSQVRLSWFVRATQRWRGSCWRSGAAISARRGSRVFAGLQQKIGGPNSRGLQWSGTDTYFFFLLNAWITFGACGPLARLESFTAGHACHARCDAAPPARQGREPCQRAHFHPLTRRVRRSFAVRPAKLNETAYELLAAGMHLQSCLKPRVEFAPLEYSGFRTDSSLRPCVLDRYLLRSRGSSISHEERASAHGNVKVVVVMRHNYTPHRDPFCE